VSTTLSSDSTGDRQFSLGAISRSSRSRLARDLSKSFGRRHATSEIVVLIRRGTATLTDARRRSFDDRFTVHRCPGRRRLTRVQPKDDRLVVGAPPLGLSHYDVRLTANVFRCKPPADGAVSSIRTEHYQTGSKRAGGRRITSPDARWR
jgi:hypothetical protein